MQFSPELRITFVRKVLGIELFWARIEMIEFNNRDWIELENLGLRLD